MYFCPSLLSHNWGVRRRVARGAVGASSKHVGIHSTASWGPWALGPAEVSGSNSDSRHAEAQTPTDTYANEQWHHTPQMRTCGPLPRSTCTRARSHTPQAHVPHVHAGQPPVRTHRRAHTSAHTGPAACASPVEDVLPLRRPRAKTLPLSETSRTQGC